MTAANIAEIKEKIRLMLNLADSSKNDSEGEINNAMRFAAKLMATYHISEDDMEKYKDGHEKAALHERMDCDKVYSQGAKLALWEELLVGFVCQFVGSVQSYVKTQPEQLRGDNGTIVFSRKGQPEIRRVFVFYGPDEDVKLATDLYVELSFEIACMSRMRYGSVLRSDGAMYCRGFVAGLSRRLSEQKLALQRMSDSTALVVQSDKNALVKCKAASQWLAETQGIKLTSRKANYSAGNGNMDAFEKGKSDSEKWNNTQTRTKKLTN